MPRYWQDGFGSAMDLNCAEKILYGANWAYNMKLPGEALKLAAGFMVVIVESSQGVRELRMALWY